MLGSAISACTRKDVNSLPYWNDYGCREAFLSYVYNASLNDDYTDAVFNLDNYNDLEAKFSDFLNWYETESGYSFTNDVNSSQYNPLQNNLIKICNDDVFPGICNTFLTSGPCANVTQGGLAGNNVMTSLCGCYTKQSSFTDYNHYTLGTDGCLNGGDCNVCTEIGDNCQIIPACNPTCNRSNVIQLANVNNAGAFKETCPKSFCIIDQTTINIEGGNIPGGINFNNQCGGCGIDNLGCVCVVNGTNINTVAANIGVGVNFNTLCNSSTSTCIENGVQVPCNINPADAEPDDKAVVSWRFMVMIGVILLIVLIVAIVIIVLTTKKN